MKIRPVAAVFFRADGGTDMTKLIAAFRNLGTRLKCPLGSLQWPG
jgi:hypothetical protein